MHLTVYSAAMQAGSCLLKQSLLTSCFISSADAGAKNTKLHNANGQPQEETGGDGIGHEEGAD